MSSNQPIGAAVIGCGHIGTQHAGFLADSKRARLELVCDLSGEAVDRLAAQVGAIPTTRVSEVLDHPDVDAVWICTHHDTHRDLAVRAAEAGKHVFIEKPLALSLADCAAIVEAVENAGVTAMTGFKFRFYPALIAAHLFLPDPVITTAHVVDDLWPEGHWANDPVKGGGNVLSEGVHIIDLVTHLHHGPPVRLHAEGGRLVHKDGANPDHAVLSMTFADGSIASIAIGESGQPPHASKFGIQMSGHQKSLNLFDRLTALMTRGPDGIEMHRDSKEADVDAIDDAFLQALISGKESPCNARDGQRATALILAAFQSIRTGLPVDLTRPPFAAAVGIRA